MRRTLLILLFAMVLLAPFLLRRWLGLAAAPRGDLTLIIMTPHQEGIRREFADAFSDWHRRHFGQTVVIDYRGFGASDMVKYFRSARDTLYASQGTYKIDLAWGGGDVLFDQQLKRDDVLEPLALEPRLLAEVYPNPTLNGIDLYDRSEGPCWYGTALSSFGIVYNRDVVRYLGLPEPRTWADLADPRYRGWIVLADPARSGSARQAFMIIVEHAMLDAAKSGTSEDEAWARGMGLVRQIAANARLFTDNASMVPALVSSGDAGAGMAIDFYGRSQADAVGADRMAYIEPAGATIVNPDPIALVKGAEHRELAERFIQFVLSEEGQRLWNTRAGLPGGPRQTSLRRLPIRPSVYRFKADFTDPIDPFTTMVGFAKSHARERTFDILGELIQDSCMDLLEDLRDTRAAILASPRAGELDAQLGRFPFDQSEALARQSQWKKATAAERLQLQRRWTAEFYDEYRRLRAAAEGWR